MLKPFIVLSLGLGLSSLALADLAEITSTVDYIAFQKVELDYSTPLTFDLTSLPANAIVQNATVFISLSTDVTSIVPFSNPVATWDQLTTPAMDFGPGAEIWNSVFQQGASLDVVPITLNAQTPTAIGPQYIIPGGSLDATLSFFGENNVVGCDPDANGSCNNGPLEPPFGVVGEASGTLDISYTLPGEVATPEPSYLLVTCFPVALIIGLTWYRHRQPSRKSRG
jgi:hypothetical protein